MRCSASGQAQPLCTDSSDWACIEVLSPCIMPSQMERTWLDTKTLRGGDIMCTCLITNVYIKEGYALAILRKAS